jgi:hypothetical protein
MDISALFKQSWERFLPNIGGCIGVVLVGSIVGGLLSGLTLGIAGIPVFAGMFKALRKVQQGGSADFGDLFSEFSNFGKWFMVWVLMIGVAIVSALTFGLGGIAAGFLLYFTMHLMLDRDMQAFDAAKASFEYVKSNFGLVFVPILLAMLVSSAGSIAIYIGALVTVPWMMVAGWFIYDWSIGGGGGSSSSDAAAE